MKKNVKTIRLSVSSIRTYLSCPAKYYFEHVRKIPQRKDYPRLCGTLVHDFVKLMYKKKQDERKFWFESKDSARKSWFYFWGKALKESRDSLIEINGEKADKFGAVGWKCIENYWNANVDRPDPIEIEKKYVIPWCRGVELSGVPDQKRSVTLESIAKIRPEIIENGNLLEEYDPFIIVDLKTGYEDYDVDPNASKEEIYRKQFEIQRSLQAAAYTLLYKRHFNKYPAFFLFYRLRDNKTFPVRGDQEESQKILRDTINHILSNIYNESFPKYAGNHCKYCDFVAECVGNTDFYVSIPTFIPQSVLINRREGVKEPRQLKFRFKYTKDKNN